MIYSFKLSIGSLCFQSILSQLQFLEVKIIGGKYISSPFQCDIQTLTERPIPRLSELSLMTTSLDDFIVKALDVDA